VTLGTLPRIFRSLVPRAAVLAGSLTLAGCNSIREMTSGLTESTELPKNAGALNRFAEDWGQRYDRNPKDKKTAKTYANALRALGQHAQAVAVLQGLPKALADAGV
jgi:Flp pilus assembly protein TadD